MSKRPYIINQAFVLAGGRRRTETESTLMGPKARSVISTYPADRRHREHS